MATRTTRDAVQDFENAAAIAAGKPNRRNRRIYRDARDAASQQMTARIPWTTPGQVS